MRLLTIFVLFSVAEYVLRTFVEPYKYHEVGLFLEFLPLTILSFIGGIIYNRAISNDNSLFRTYFKLIGTSTGGLVVAKGILFIQWYWFIAPEYRNVPGDMGAGFGWLVFFSAIGTIVISISYIIVILPIKAFQKGK